MGLAKVKEGQDRVLSILKLSYHKLESPLKSCFSYCAIFPKDYKMEKDTLIRLWMAHDYIPLNDHQSLEELGEEYFSILLRSCFFQDVEKDEKGNIRSCKIHDLMHDLAQQVAGKDICIVESMSGDKDVDKKVRHISLVRLTNNFSITLNKSHLRSCRCINELYERFNMDQFCVDALVGDWKYLRALGLHLSNIKSLSSSIGDLIHLRYLDLSNNSDLKVLPGSITKLYNLQTLKLCYCQNLKKLPKDLSKLVKLRVLNLEFCCELKYMPTGMHKLSCLHTINEFVLGDVSSSKKNLSDGLEDLKALSNLKGSLEIKIRFMKIGYKINGGKEGGCLGNKGHLEKVVFDFHENGRREYDEALMDELQPHSNLKRLEVWGYEEFGTIMASSIENITVVSLSKPTAILECPALEDLQLVDVNDRLKIVPILGGGASSYEIGSNLAGVEIDNVAWLKSLPMNSFHDGAKLHIAADFKVECLGEAMEVFGSCAASLKYLKISNCRKLRSVVRGGLEHLSALEELVITSCDNLSESEEVENVSFCPSLRILTLGLLDQMVELPNWIQYLSALQTLHARYKKVESMTNWMSKLTSLRELQVSLCSAQLKERCQEPTGEDWPHIQHIPSIVFEFCRY